MSRLEQQLREDRALRDAALTVLQADIALARTSFSGKGLADRVGGRIGDGAKDVLETAKTHADGNRGMLAALIGAMLLWIAREPIMAMLGLADAAPDDEIDDTTSPAGDEEVTNAEFGPETGLESDKPL
jgi:hypothetical protein